MNPLTQILIKEHELLFKAEICTKEENYRKIMWMAIGCILCGKILFYNYHKEEGRIGFHYLQPTLAGSVDSEMNESFIVQSACGTGVGGQNNQRQNFSISPPGSWAKETLVAFK